MVIVRFPLNDMAMGNQAETGAAAWICADRKPGCGGDSGEDAFYDRLNQILDEHKFDGKVERLCHKFYKKSPYSRPSMYAGRLLSVSS